MYIPKLFKQDNRQEIQAFVEQHGFAILVTQGTEQSLMATHLPLMWSTNKEGKDVLLGHLAKGNVQWKHSNLHAVLAIFQGPHAYISSSWYDHENVSTWNYMAVHIYGNMRVVSEEELLESLRQLTNKYEASSTHPVSVEGMNPEMVQKEMRGIVGIEIEITDIQAAYKLSQNRDDKNHNAIIDQLKRKGDENAHAIAEGMKKNRH